MTDRGRSVGGGELTVLFVDDYPEYVTAGEEYLQKVDGSMTVLPETTVEGALERVASEQVDCVVSDYEMPEMNGLEFLDAVREHRPDVPFVLLTGHDVTLPDSEAAPGSSTDVLQKGNGTHTFEELRAKIRDVTPREPGFSFDNIPG